VDIVTVTVTIIS